MARATGHVVVLLFFVLAGGSEVALAQMSGHSRPPAETRSHFCEEELRGGDLDLRGLALVYCATSPEVSVPLRGAHASARPIFYGAIPAAWIGAGVTQDQEVVAAAYRLTLAQSLTYGIVLGVKHATRRPRPYVRHSLRARVERYRGASGREEGRLSFPSGHASVSAAIATSWGLSAPRWYVIGPGALWAIGVSLSRLHLGVHYPSDILVGTVLGAGVALLVHQLRTVITPSPLQGTARTHHSLGIPVGVHIRF